MGRSDRPTIAPLGWGSPRYRLLQRIGVGGMAELFLAEAADGKSVAIKRILPAYADDPHFVSMFRNEAQISLGLSHPNVVQTHEISTDNDELYLVMEYLDGETVRTLLRRCVGLSVADAVRIGIGISDGLHYAHERRIIHRDVSPQNVMITSSGAIKVLDFGIAKAAHRSSLTNHGTVKGKVPYMSPEQSAGEALDRRSDIYAIGVILYEIALGRRPHAAESDVALIRQIQDDPIPKPSQIHLGFPADLERILLKALAKRRGQRYQTAAELASALRRYASDAGIDLAAFRLSERVSEARSRANVASVPPPDPAPEEPRAHRAAPQEARIERRPVRDGVLVTLSGRLTERLEGAALARDLSGVVIFDLFAVERVTSFGVREWLQAMSLLSAEIRAGRVRALYFARCSAAVVNQLTMIGGFAGPGEVLSFCAPYQCRSCALDFEREISGRHESPPEEACPKCGRPASFDDDPGFFKAINALVAAEIPPDVAAALRSPAAKPSPPPAVEKRIEGDETQIIASALDPQIRWGRILDGIEGALSVDLSGVQSAPPEGAASLALALDRLPASASPISIVCAPLPLVPLLGASRARFASVSVVAHCERCRSAGRWSVAASEPSTARCARCQFSLPLVALPLAPSDRAAIEALYSPAQRHTPRPRGRRAGLAALVLSMLVTAAGTFAAALLAITWATLPERSAEERHAPPAWAGHPLLEGPDEIVLVGRGVDLTEARLDALASLLDLATERLSQSPVAPAVAPAPSDPQQRREAAARFDEAFGAVASPERTEVFSEPGSDVVARYVIRTPALDALLSSAVETSNLGAMVLADGFPPGRGVFVVEGGPIGARVLARSGEPLRSRRDLPSDPSAVRLEPPP